MWCLWGKTNAIWLKIHFCERSSNCLICWINQWEAVSSKESATPLELKDGACIASGINSWKSIRSHGYSLFEKFWTVTVMLQALSQSNASLLPKGLLPIFAVSCYLPPTPVHPLSHFWLSRFTLPLLQAPHLTGPFHGPHLTHRYRRKLCSWLQIYFYFNSA